MSILGIDHIECYVADQQAAAGALCRDFGFTRDDQYGLGDVTAGDAQGAAPSSRSVMLRQGTIALLLTAAGTPGDQAADYVERHGDGVASIAFRTDNVAEAFEQAVMGGARPITAPRFADQHRGRIGQAVVSGFGDVTHRLVERAGSPAGLPADGERRCMFHALDHAAICLPAGQIDGIVRFYREAFGFSHVFDERIEVNGQAMISRVVQGEASEVTFTLIEPDPTHKPGQIDEFLDRHGGAGVQHLALRTADIAQAVRTLSARGVPFLAAPGGYYRRLEHRLGALAIPVDVLREVNVLADRDQWGQLFQIFTRSTHERGTFFIELVERRGALTFGSGNIKALYQALGEEQAAKSPPASRG